MESQNELRCWLLKLVHDHSLAYPCKNEDGTWKLPKQSIVPAMIGTHDDPGETKRQIYRDKYIGELQIYLNFVPLDFYPRLVVNLQKYGNI